MEFIHPYWLFGILAIAVPIIIHLFNFRRYRKYFFTNLKLLKSIKKETKKQHRIRHLLILFSRILAIILLSLAFARPYLPGPEGMKKSEVNKISFYIDNSMSMQASSNGYSLLDDALAKAAEVAEAYNHSDRFILITNDFEGKHQRSYNRDEFVKLLQEIKISPKSRQTPEVYGRLMELSDLQDNEKVHFYLISDFQRSTTELNAFSEDTTIFAFLMPLITKAPSNVYIDSCWLASPFNHAGQQQGLHVRFTNASDLDLEKIPVRLIINDKQRALASFDIQAGSRAEVRLPFTNREPGLQHAQISIDDYPITWDDQMFASWSVKDKIPVMSISEGPSGFYLKSLFTNDSVFEYSQSELRKLDYSRFGEMDFIVLDNISKISSGLSSELTSYMAQGGNIFLIPGRDADLPGINMFLQILNAGILGEYDTSTMLATGLNNSHMIFEDVFESIPENIDLPSTSGHFPLMDYRKGGGDVIIELQNTDPLITVTKYEKGKLYLMSSPAGDEYNKLIRHALWVPILYRMAMLSRPQYRLFYVLGEDNSVRVNEISLQGDQSLKMKIKDSEYEFIPGYMSSGDGAELMFYDQIRFSGQYQLFSVDRHISSYAFNYDRKESDPDIFTIQEISDKADQAEARNTFLINPGDKAVSQSVTEFNKGTELWKICIWLALLFILTEILLLRLFRK